MKEFFKRLFCKHDYVYLFHRNFMFKYSPKSLYIFECSKCGKRTKRITDL